MYLATLRTTNFEFLTVSDTETGARQMMRKAWNTHRKQTGAFYDWEFLSDDVAVNFVRIGDTFRDGELMYSGNTQPTTTN